MQTDRLLAVMARAGILLVAASSKLFGQVVDPAWDERGEVSIFTGMAFGTTGSRAAVGGSTAVWVSKYGALSIGSTFMPLGRFTLVPYPAVTVQSRLYDSSFSLDVQVPIKRRWAPYGILATALLFNTYQLQRTRTDGTVFFTGENDVKFGFEGGAGVRYGIKDEWGVKGEYRRIVSTRDFNRLVFGVYYRLPSNWPFLPRGRTRSRGRVY